MENQILRDEGGRRIAEILTLTGDRQIIRDAGGRRLGEYDAKTNITRDAVGSRVGTGNLLASLIQHDRE